MKGKCSLPAQKVSKLPARHVLYSHVLSVLGITGLLHVSAFLSACFILDSLASANLECHHKLLDYQRLNKVELVL
eukprot:3422106-Amphidinium_carterae.1